MLAKQVRTERIDFRVTPAQKAILLEKARKTRRTVTSLVEQLIDEIDKVVPDPL